MCWLLVSQWWCGLASKPGKTGSALLMLTAWRTRRAWSVRIGGAHGDWATVGDHTNSPGVTRKVCALSVAVGGETGRKERPTNDATPRDRFGLTRRLGSGKHDRQGLAATLCARKGWGKFPLCPQLRLSPTSTIFLTTCCSRFRRRFHGFRRHYNLRATILTTRPMGSIALSSTSSASYAGLSLCILIFCRLMIGWSRFTHTASPNRMA